MVYVDNDGTVREGDRSLWTPSGFINLFWSFLTFIILFFRSLFDPTITKYGRNVETNYRTGNGRGGGGGGGRGERPPDARPRRRYNGFGSGGSGPGCSPMAGG